mgnify:CR=1 FL=1
MEIEYSTAKNKYGFYCVPKSSSHRGGAKTILEGKVWEPDTVEFVLRNISGDIIHAGTYFGDMLPAFSSVASHVWAFEPLPENFYCANKTIEWNCLKNVTLHNRGLSNKSGEVTFVIEKNNKSLGGGCHILQNGMKSVGKTMTIKTEKIDDMVPDDRNVSIIQLDVEGNEFAALKGAEKTIDRCNPILIIEKWKRRPMELEFKSWLKSKDYKFVQNLHGDINDVWVKNEFDIRTK